MLAYKLLLHIPNFVEARCSGCVDKPTYESAVGSFCTADVGKTIFSPDNALITPVSDFKVLNHCTSHGFYGEIICFYETIML